MGIPAGRKIDITYHAFEQTPYISANQYVILDNMLLRVNLNEEQFLKIPAGIREIKADACKTIWNFSVREIILPVSVKYIGNRAFADLFGLQTVLLESGREKEYFFRLVRMFLVTAVIIVYIKTYIYQIFADKLLWARSDRRAGYPLTTIFDVWTIEEDMEESRIMDQVTFMFLTRHIMISGE